MTRTALSTQKNMELQLKERQRQLRALRREIKTGRFSDDDLDVLRGREESLLGMIAMYQDNLATA